MPTAGRVWAGWAVAILAAAGCRTPPAPVVVNLPEPTAPAPPLQLPPASPSSFDPDLAQLPVLNAAEAAAIDVAPPPTGLLAVSETAVRHEAATRAPLASLLEQETRTCPDGDRVAREVRMHLAAEVRNRAAAQALEQFFQLADAEGRGELLRDSLGVLDAFRGTVRTARAEGVRVPVDPDDLDRQRAAVLALVGQADLGARLLDIDLKRRLGVDGKETRRLRPIGPFPVAAAPVNVEAAVQVALERRPDLRALRAAYFGLTPDRLPAMRDLIRMALVDGSSSGAIGAVPHRPNVLPAPTLLTALRARNLPPWLDAATVAELGVRRQQLYDLIVMRERQGADEVRAAASTLAAQERQVALARWRAESLLTKAADARKQGPLAEQPAVLEAFRARADVVAAVMGWHQARVKLAAAQGVLVGE